MAWKKHEYKSSSAHKLHFDERNFSSVFRFISPFKRYRIELNIFHLNTLAYYPQVVNQQGDVQFPEIHSVQSQGCWSLDGHEYTECIDPHETCSYFGYMHYEVPTQSPNLFLPK